MKLVSFCGVIGLAVTPGSVGCASPEPVETKPPTALTAPAAPRPICAAIDSSAKLLREQGLAWGEPRQILRTGSNWYRIEYENDPRGMERVVLVDPFTGHAEFPMPR